MSEVFAAACSIAATRRKRFMWAAWWSGPPTREPFRKPDAAKGGARTREAALREAEQIAGRPLVEIDGRWARAWARVLVGEAPWSERQQAAAGESPHALPPRRAARREGARSIWEVLGVNARVTMEELRRAFRKRALETHPDHGGSGEAFREVHAAYAEACKRTEKKARRPKRR